MRIATGLLWLATLWCQPNPPAGLIQFVQGDVQLDGRLVPPSESASFPDRFATWTDGARLDVGLGRAEVLLTPGIVLRLAENSAVLRKKEKNFSLLGGSMILEVIEDQDGAKILIEADASTVELSRRGVYVVNVNPLRVMVLEGRAEIRLQHHKATAQSFQMVLVENGLRTVESAPSDAGPLLPWSQQRARILAMASLSAAKSGRDADEKQRSPVWKWNPYFGIYTYMPVKKNVRSPFGYPYVSLNAVHEVFQRQASLPDYDPDQPFEAEAGRSRKRTRP